MPVPAPCRTPVLADYPLCTILSGTKITASSDSDSPEHDGPGFGVFVFRFAAVAQSRQLRREERPKADQTSCGVRQRGMWQLGSQQGQQGQHSGHEPTLGCSFEAPVHHLDSGVAGSEGELIEKGTLAGQFYDAHPPT